MRVVKALQWRGAGPLAAAGGVVMTGWGVFGDGRIDPSDWRSIGILMVVAVTVHWSLRVAVLPMRDVYDLGHEAGMRDEAVRASQAVKPTVVPLHRKCASCQQEEAARTAT